MNHTRLFSVLFSLLLIASIIPSVNATIEKEYEEEMYQDGSKHFAFKVRLVIETEEDGTWKTDSSYQLDFILVVTYFNNTHFQGDPLNFSAREGYEGKFVYVEGTHVTYTLLTHVSCIYVYSPITKKMASFRFSPRSEERVKVYPVLTIRDAKVHEGVFYDHYWGGLSGYASVEPVYIDAKSPLTPSRFPSELIFMVAGIVIGAVVVGTIFIVKRRKEKFNPSKR